MKIHSKEQSHSVPAKSMTYHRILFAFFQIKFQLKVLLLHIQEFSYLLLQVWTGKNLRHIVLKNMIKNTTKLNAWRRRNQHLDAKTQSNKRCWMFSMLSTQRGQAWGERAWEESFLWSTEAQFKFSNNIIHMDIFIILGLLDFQSLLYKELSKGEEVERCLTSDFIEMELEFSRTKTFDPERALKKKYDSTRSENLIFPHH